MTKLMTLTKRLININRSPRRLDRQVGGRNKRMKIQRNQQKITNNFTKAFEKLQPLKY